MSEHTEGRLSGRAWETAGYELLTADPTLADLERGFLWNAVTGTLVTRVEDASAPYEVYEGVTPERVAGYEPAPGDTTMSWADVVVNGGPAARVGLSRVALSALQGDGWVLVTQPDASARMRWDPNDLVEAARLISEVREDCEAAGWTRDEVMGGFERNSSDPATEAMAEAVRDAHDRICDSKCLVRTFDDRLIAAATPCRGRFAFKTPDLDLDECLVAVDNTLGDFLMEDFSHREATDAWIGGATDDDAYAVDWLVGAIESSGVGMRALEEGAQLEPTRVTGDQMRAIATAIGAKPDGSERSGDGMRVNLPEGMPPDEAWVICDDRATGNDYPWVSVHVSDGVALVNGFHSLACAESCLAHMMETPDLHSVDEAVFGHDPYGPAVAGDTHVWAKLADGLFSAWNPRSSLALDVNGDGQSSLWVTVWHGATAAEILLEDLVCECEHADFYVDELIQRKSCLLVEADDDHVEDLRRIAALVNGDDGWVIGRTDEIRRAALDEYAESIGEGRNPSLAEQRDADRVSRASEDRRTDDVPGRDEAR